MNVSLAASLLIASALTAPAAPPVVLHAARLLDAREAYLSERGRALARILLPFAAVTVTGIP